MHNLYFYPNSNTIPKMRFWLVLQLALFVVTGTAALYNNNETDHVALLAMKSKILDYSPFGALSSWNESFHFCNWEGVMCGKMHKRVTLIDLSSLGLLGTLSPYVGNLTFLRQLRLDNNTFHGEIPSEIGNLYRLKVLVLQRNSFEGRIPISLSRCSNLTHLVIGFNNLVGTIPEEFSSLSMLKRIYVHDNDLTGGVPNSVGNITSLEIFSAGANLFGGTIPNNLGQLKNLKELGLGGNQISGIIPSSLYNLSNLNILSLPMNELHGSLPPYFGNMFPHLEWLQLHFNNFTGILPKSIGNLTKANRMAFEHNDFSGKLTVDFSKLVNLLRVTLPFNNFGSGDFDEMHFLGSLTNCSDLGVLDISNNQFRGVLPEFVGNLSSNIRFFALGANQLQGRIPPTIGNLVNLSILGLEVNQFTGTIPSTIGKLQKLQKFGLSGNQLSGTIPESIGNLSLVIELYLSYNNLEGTIPSSIGNCQRLLTLLLEQNNLSGTIPKELFQVSSLSILLNLSHNHLSGPLPSEIGELKSLVTLDISNNNELSGEIPSSISSCTSLESLFLQGNMLQGSIPMSMEFLKGVQILDLSRNNLSGQIPSFLEKLSLIKLNLSFNDFNGELPLQGAFANSSAVSIYGNDRLCGGIPSFELPRCPAKKLNSNFSYKYIFAIVAASIGMLILLSSSVFYFRKRKRQGTTTLEVLPKGSFAQVSYDELFKATDGFSSSNLIGAGSFGFVYKGVLDQIGDVAIKVLNLVNRGATKSFMAECKVLKNTRHRNLIKIITCCSSIDFQGNEFKALVYELMPNGNLENLLHPSSSQETSRPEFNLLQRLTVAIDVASALDYLHYQCETPIIHRDLKPSNILLDKQMVAHVGDFGLARLYPEIGLSHHSSSVGVMGTIGYAAPEYGLGSEISIKGDVYSYGILLLEMLTGKRPTDLMFADGLNLRNFAGQALAGNDEVVEMVMDPTILKSDTAFDHQRDRDSCLIAMVKIGVACSEELPQNRLSMVNVIRELQLIKEASYIQVKKNLILSTLFLP